MSKDRFVQFLFYLFVFLVPWQTVYLVREVFVGGEKWQYGTIGIYLSDLVLVALCGTVIILQWREVISDLMKKPSWGRVFAILFTLYILFSASWAYDAELALYYSAKIFLVISLVYSARFFSVSIERAFVVFLTSLLLQVGIGLWQFILQTSFASTLLGIAAQDAWRGGASVIESGGRWLRAYGGQAHPNIFGGLMAIGLVFSVGFALSWKRLRRIFFTFSSILFTAGLFVSFSRSAFIASVAGLGLLGVALWRYKLQGKKFFFALVILLCTVFAGLYSQYTELFHTRADHSSRLEQLSISERTSQVGEAIAMIATHPVIGVGIGNYTHALRVSDGDTREIWQYQPVHNVDLLIITELGLLGTVLLVGLFWFFFSDAISYFSKQEKKQKYHTSIIFISLITFCITAIFDHWQWDSHVGLFTFGFLLSLCVINMQLNKK